MSLILPISALLSVISLGEEWVSEGLPLLFQGVSMSFPPLPAMSSSWNYSLLERKKKTLADYLPTSIRFMLDAFPGSSITSSELPRDSLMF